MLETELERAKAENTQMAAHATPLKDSPESKEAALVYANNIIKDDKKKVLFFLDHALPQIRKQCYEKALFITYFDNVDHYPELDFPSLPTLKDKLKRKLDLKLGRVFG